MNIQNLTMSFGLQTIYDNVSFQINENDKVGIVGVNGAGKSTLFNLILGKLTPDEGKIIIKLSILLHDFVQPNPYLHQKSEHSLHQHQ